MEGAESELIVPSGHAAHQNPQAIEEVHRILKLNARSTDRSTATPQQMMTLLRSILRTLELALGWLLLAIGGDPGKDPSPVPRLHSKRQRAPRASKVV
jgi:hypothetical protein